MRKVITHKCPTCGAKYNEPCRTPKGRKKNNVHNDRSFDLLLVDSKVEIRTQSEKETRTILLGELKKKALEALKHLPSVCQGIGTAAARARRCNVNSRIGKKRWAMHASLFRRSNDLLHDIRAALRELK